MKKILVALTLCLNILNATAQQAKLKGLIKDDNGSPVPFVSVFIKGTTKGTSANADGGYALALESGSHTIVFKAIGYKPLEKQLLFEGDMNLDIVLQAESYLLPTVAITASGEDPAYAIIRRAIRQRPRHLKEVKAYTADVYIKGLQKLVGAPKSFFGQDIQQALDLDTNRKGILYLSESTSHFAFRQPDQIHEEMISSKVAGRNNAFSFNKASDLMLNFYENILLENVLSTRGFVSPIADNALQYYRYKFIGSSTQDGQIVDKIQVLPRGAYDPAFSGFIYINDESYHLVNADLYLTEKSGINLLDTIQIAQQSLLVDQNTYMPSNVSFQFKGKVLGFKFEGYYVGVYSDYDLHPSFPRGYFNGEILKVTRAANKKDSLFWLRNRPIPLTEEESQEYIRKDSLSALRASKTYLDSVEKANNRFSFFKFLATGHKINDRYRQQSFDFDPLHKSVFFNTVEGYAIKYGMTYTKFLSDRKYYTLRPAARYGFSNELLTGTLAANYYYNPKKKANLSVEGGTGIFDLNNLGTMSLLGNTINSLFFETNFSKYYKKHYIQVSAGYEIANGLQGNLLLSYSRNFNQRNSTRYKIKDLKGEEYTSNNPFTPAMESPLFPTYNSAVLNATLTYIFGQTYITRPDGKFYQPPKYPVITLNYKKGIKNIVQSTVDYDLLTLEIAEDKIKSGMLGYSSVVAGVGKFLNNNTIYYPDFKHFRGNNSLLSKPNLRKFLFLDFYLYSTERQYAEFHFEHNFSGFFTNQVPLLRKLKLEELVGVSYLTQPIKRNYTEFYFGLQRLILRAAYGFAYDGNKRVNHGIRLTYGF